MIFYIVSIAIIAFTMFDYIKDIKLKYSVMAISFILLGLFSGLRSNLTQSYYAYDTSNYINIFENIENINSMEYGYILINKIIKFFTDKPIYLLLIMSFITLYFIYRYTEYYSSKFFLSLAAYVILFYYIREFGQIRASLAYAIIIFSSKYIFEKLDYKFFIGLVIATFIHRSAILGIAMYFFKNKNIKDKYLYFILLLSFLLFNFNILTLVMPFIERFSDNIYIDKIIRYTKYSNQRLIDIKVIMYFIIAFISIYMRKYINLKKYDFKLYLIVMAIFIMSLLSESDVLSVRGSELFLSFIPLIIPDVLDVISNKYIKYILYIIIIFCFIIYNLVFFNTIRHGLFYT